MVREKVKKERHWSVKSRAKVIRVRVFHEDTLKIFLPLSDRGITETLKAE